MSDCKCKAILNIIPKCDPTLDIRPNCPVVLDVTTTQRGAPGKDATINGVNTLEIITADGITGTMDGETFTISGAELEQAIADEETRAKGVEQELSGSIESNHTAISNHVADKNNPHVVTKSQVGLGNCDNTSDADKPVSTATQTALNGKVDKTTTASKVYGTDASGNQTTYDADSFGKVDDVKVDGVSVVTNKVANLGTMASETASDYYTSSQVDTALAGKQGTLTASTGIDITSDTISVTDPTIVNNGTGTKALAVGKTSQSTAEGGVAVGYGAQANSTYGTAVGYESRASNTNTTVIGKGAKATQARGIAIGSGAEATAQDAIAIKGVNNTANTFQVYTYNMLDMSTGLIPDARISTNIARTSAIPTVDQVYDSTSSNPQSGIAVASAVSGEATLRQNADNGLQTQIDAITASSDVKDIVGTYAELQAYDTSTLGNNDIVKVLQDENENNETTYYRWVITGGVGAWVLIGAEGPYYTISSANATFVPQTTEVNGHALSSNITLTASDVGALPDSTVIPTVNDATLAIQKNSTTVGSFSANSNTNTTIDLSIPTDTSDLTNGAGYITGITSTDVTNALGYTPYDDTNPDGFISGITSGDVTTALGYTPYDDSNPDGFISGITSGDVTTALGYTPVDPANLGTMATESANDYTPTSGLATVATSGDYDDLLNKPTIPAAQVNSDWNANSGVAEILNKPTLGTMASESASDYTPTASLATVATSGLYSDLSGTPTIPTVDQTYDGTSSNPQSGVAIAGAGFITGITSGDVTTALGYTPYDATNPSGYISSASVSGLTDVTLSSLANGDVLIYNSTSQEWENGTVGGSVSYDGTTINENSSNELQAIGVIDKNSGNAKYDWVGTLSEYTTQDIENQHPDWICYITDDSSVTSAILGQIYPVGSIYIGTMSVCPMATLISGSTWVLVASDRVLQGSGSNVAGTTKSAGLPNITGQLGYLKQATTSNYNNPINIKTGAFSSSFETTASPAQKCVTPSTTDADKSGVADFNASNSNSIYGNSTTVQPPAYIVNIWERTA